ncbi:uncharacterized protein BYT42DRAFT_553666 [Radiomyces spectabilis]|uniref:uncharacterized protein n=1 Tax=Radiomyces spectabilis TaxID=64574 RepID=UPI00221E49E3|nr:uncharacterized protein BYT42DRAFT_553666 [Radiomyces spectabilis]KAI8394193.1 hypothetical protein BYT42DRAFT_553666 [Radiomyces spectabilis]
MNATAGSYLGKPAEDPDASLRDVFAKEENHPDALASILKYCQNESGFKVGDRDTSKFGELLASFQGVLDQQSMMPYSTSGSKDSVMGSINNFLSDLPDKSKLETFTVSLPPGPFDSSLVHFCIQQQGYRLFLYIATVLANGDDYITIGVAVISKWELNRDETIARADELVEKTKLKEQLDDWLNGITSSGYE